MTSISRLAVLLLTSIALTCSPVFAQKAEKPEKPQKPQKAEKPKRAGDIRTFKASDGKELTYRWATPIKVEAGTKYPLVICLHGAGGNSVAPAALAEKERQEKYPCFVMAPDAGEGNGWATTPAFAGRLERPEALHRVIEAIKALMQQEPIDPARVYITGQSMGGVGTWAAIARYPELFAAAAPVCGAWDVKDAEKMVSVPIWAFHGEVDPTVPVKFSRELTEAVNKAGGHAKYKEYPGVGHGSWGPAYAEAELWEWMFQQKKAK